MNVNSPAAISAIVALVTPMFFGVRFRSRRCGSKLPLVDSVTIRDVLPEAKDARGIAWPDCGEDDG
jgi:hypothetical protein